MRRWVAKTVTLALAAGGLQAVWVADPAWACGCGAMIPGAGGTMSVAREQAVVRFDGTTEDIVMQFSMKSAVKDAAWIMPVPAPATAKLADKTLFDDLAVAELPVPDVHHYFWPHFGSGKSSSEMNSGGAMAVAPSQSAVQVLSDQRIGEFEVANLASTDPKALGDWLNQHQFTLKDSTAGRLSAYTDEGWKFVAVRLATGSAANLNGVLDPIRISFPAKSAVYPMRLSAGASTSQHVQVSVLAPHRMDDTTAPDDGTESSVFGDWINPSNVGPALASLAAGRMFLTSYDAQFDNPSLIDRDYEFGPAKTDWVQHDTYDKEELLTVLGIPVFLIVLLVLAAGAVAFVRWRWVSARTRSHGTPAQP